VFQTLYTFSLVCEVYLYSQIKFLTGNVSVSTGNSLLVRNWITILQFPEGCILHQYCKNLKYTWCNHMGRLIYEKKEVEKTIFSENSVINYKSTRRPTAKTVITYSSLYISSLYISSYVWKFIYDGWLTSYYGEVIWKK
jgi:hypothetical protein